MTTIGRSQATAMVIGCGVAGPVMAMALRKAGIDAIVYEAHDGDASFKGSFLNFASNGLDALAAIDADHAIRRCGFATPRMIMWSGSGKQLGEVTNGLVRADGSGSITIERGQLHAALRDEAAARGIHIERGKRLVSASGSAGRIQVEFADGTTAGGDLLIGTDGLHSQVRQLIDAAAPPPRFTGQLSLGGRARDTGLPSTPGVFHMMFGRRAFFGYSTPRAGDVYWFANVDWPDAPDRSVLGAVTPSMWRTRLLDLFAGDAGPATRIVAATGDELAAYPIFDMPAVPRWHRDGMIIIGDAAHATSPSSGQGASLAIEDAVTLARCLRDLDSTAAAFTAYDRLRRRRVERVVAYSARIGRSKTPGAVGRWFRDLMMPAALKLFANPKSQAWLYEHPIDWTARIS